MKKCVLMVLIAMSLGCSLVDIYASRIQLHPILYNEDFNDLRSYTEIVAYINSKVQYKNEGFNDYWQTPQETLERGFGDCEDFALLFINIYYVVFNAKCDLLLLADDSGLIVTHAVVGFGDITFDPRSGSFVHNKVLYRYDFDQLLF